MVHKEDNMIYLSSNGFSVDTQLQDVINYLEKNDVEAYEAFLAEFPEWESVDFGGGSWIDHEAMGVDVEWSDWARDWVEHNTPVRWHECEPVIFEPTDNNYDAFG